MKKYEVMCKWDVIREFTRKLFIIAVIGTIGNWALYLEYRAGYIGFMKAWALGFAEMTAFGGIILLLANRYIHRINKAKE